MVKVRDDHPLDLDGVLDIQTWLTRVSKGRSDTELTLIEKSCNYVKSISKGLTTKYGEPCLEQGLTMAEVLHDLGLNTNTIVASIIYGPYKRGKIPEKDITQNFGEEIANLIFALCKVDATHEHSQINIDQIDFMPETTDNLRKMLLSLSSDIRALLIKLSEYLCDLRYAKNLSDPIKRKIALEGKNVFGPVANRLGIGQIKWEIEDLVFRYLEPKTYKNIAEQLAEKRLARENYIKDVINSLKEELQSNSIIPEVYGRAKHIYSIYKKMLRKNVDYSEIYDVRAIRIVVNEISECYAVLGIVHSLWEHIPKEFDDYIARPKPNGYQSLHTAVIGPEGKVIEIQIRTKLMQENSELGVASHWCYKEGRIYDHKQDKNLSNLRQAINWQEELQLDNDNEENYSESRIYVFTPRGDVIDLPEGSTPLDFAYKIHTDVGNKCRGARVNGKIAQLTSKLTNGSMVEILAAKIGGPSRDWLNPNLGFIRTPRARSKIQNWFKKQDREDNIKDGKDIINKELKRIGIYDINMKDLLPHLGSCNGEEDIYANLAVGDLRISQILGAIQKLSPKPKEPKIDSNLDLRASDKKNPHSYKDPVIKISGIGNLVHHLARCCKPRAGEDIIGYITISGSVSVHKKDCINILQSKDKKHSRLIEVTWGGKSKNNYLTNIKIKAYIRRGLLKDITNIIESEGADLISINSVDCSQEHTVEYHAGIEISSISKLGALLSKIQRLSNIIDVYRES